MALVEIEDQYLAQLQNAGVPAQDRTGEYRKARDYQTFFDSVGQNPKHRDKLLELIADTGTYVPEIARVREVEDKFDQRLKNELKPLHDFLEEQKKEREQSQQRSVERLIDDGRSFLRAQGWDDEGVKEVETFMQQNSVGSYKVASEHLKRQKPDPSPLPTSSWNGSNLGTEWFNAAKDAPDHKLLLDNPQAFSNQEVAKFFREKAEGRLKL